MFESDHLHIAVRLKMNGAIPMLEMRSWLEQKNFRKSKAFLADVRNA